MEDNLTLIKGSMFAGALFGAIALGVSYWNHRNPEANHFLQEESVRDLDSRLETADEYFRSGMHNANVALTAKEMIKRNNHSDWKRVAGYTADALSDYRNAIELYKQRGDNENAQAVRDALSDLYIDALLLYGEKDTWFSLGDEYQLRIMGCRSGNCFFEMKKGNRMKHLKLTVKNGDWSVQSLIYRFQDKRSLPYEPWQFQSKVDRRDNYHAQRHFRLARSNLG